MRSLFKNLLLILPAAMLMSAANAQATGETPAKPQKNIADKKQQQKPELDRNMPAWKEVMGSLSEEEKTEFKKLHEKNPEAFREALNKKMQALKAKKQEDTSKVMDLVKKYNEAQSSGEKNQFQRQIKELCEKQFDERMESNRKSIEHVEQRLTELKKKYQDRVSKKNEIIEQRLKDLTKDPSLEW